MPESASAHDVVQTHYCKAPGCTNEARSPVGRYAYCPEHQGAGLSRGAAAARRPAADGGGAEKALRDLLALARRVDRAKAKADALLVKANEAGRAADVLEDQYRAALGDATGQAAE